MSTTHTRAELEARLLDLAVDARNHIDEEADGNEPPTVVADVMLVIGTRGYSADEGVAFGAIYTFGNESGMPGYVARGLLMDAIDTVVETQP